jgi:hypothetical protein
MQRSIVRQWSVTVAAWLVVLLAGLAGCGGDAEQAAGPEDAVPSELDVSTDVPGAETDAGQDSLPDVAPDILPDVAVDAATDVVPDVPVDVVPDVPEDVAPDVAVGPIACQGDKDCTSVGKVCDPLTKLCVACLTDAECAPSQHCVALACQTYTACSNSLGCKAAKGPDGLDQPICDQKIGECSACLTAADCPASNDCKEKQCVPFLSCQKSTDCGSDQVCDKAAGRCVECLGTNDCAKNELCEAGTCSAFVPCSSDKQCTQIGLLCDQPKGKCAQCLQNSDCPEIYNCQAVGVAKTGACVLDACAQGQGACSNNQKVACNAIGNGYGSPVACADKTTCLVLGGKPDCKPWVCTPGLHCDGEKLVACSADGLSLDNTTDCAATAQKCFDGACKTLVCSPNEAACDGNTVKTCSADGLSLASEKACGGNEFCESGVCKPQTCTANATLCDGNVVKTCNANGSGTVAAADKDCGALKCLSGICKALACEPATQFCTGATLKTCSPDGLSVVKEEACGSGKFCGKNGVGDAACLPVVCQPGQPACDGNKAATCNADGSAYGAGTACGAKLCVAGACKAQLCEANTVFCDATQYSDVLRCDATGTASSAYGTCDAGRYCSAYAEAHVCDTACGQVLGAVAPATQTARRLATAATLGAPSRTQTPRSPTAEAPPAGPATRASSRPLSVPSRHAPQASPRATARNPRPATPTAAATSTCWQSAPPARPARQDSAWRRCAATASLRARRCVTMGTRLQAMGVRTVPSNAVCRAWPG